jgi:hypothetical protein
MGPEVRENENTQTFKAQRTPRPPEAHSAHNHTLSACQCVSWRPRLPGLEAPKTVIYHPPTAPTCTRLPLTGSQTKNHTDTRNHSALQEDGLSASASAGARRRGLLLGVQRDHALVQQTRHALRYVSGGSRGGREGGRARVVGKWTLREQ